MNPLSQKIKEGLLTKLQSHERDFVERIRENLKGKNLGECLRKFARDNKDEISETDLALAFYSTKANV